MSGPEVERAHTTARAVGLAWAALAAVIGHWRHARLIFESASGDQVRINSGELLGPAA